MGEKKGLTAEELGIAPDEIGITEEELEEYIGIAVTVARLAKERGELATASVFGKLAVRFNAEKSRPISPRRN